MAQKINQFYLEFKKKSVQGEIPLTTPPPRRRRVVTALRAVPRKSIKLKKWGGGIISSWSRLYTYTPGSF